jgi:hypothetical protein
VGIKGSGGFLPLTGVTGEDGSMERERALVEMLVLAITTDNQFSGVALLGPDDKELTVEVSPAIQMTGRLVNSDNEPILERQQLEYNVPIRIGGGIMTSSVTTYPISTDAEGRFILEGLCGGLEYDLHLVERSASNTRPARRFLMTFRPDDLNSDLGRYQSSETMNQPKRRILHARGTWIIWSTRPTQVIACVCAIDSRFDMPAPHSPGKKSAGSLQL